MQASERVIRSFACSIACYTNGYYVPVWHDVGMMLPIRSESALTPQQLSSQISLTGTPGHPKFTRSIPVDSVLAAPLDASSCILDHIAESVRFPSGLCAYRFLRHSTSASLASPTLKFQARARSRWVYVRIGYKIKDSQENRSRGGGENSVATAATHTPQLVN